MKVEMGYVSLDKQYIDDTKIKVASSHYTFVWYGSLENCKENWSKKTIAV
jgi:hypothetical protein